jgi:hypothetical protein
VLRLREEEGLSEFACLSFDVACVEFDTRYTQEAERMKEVPMPKRHGPPTTLVPARELDELKFLLGLVPHFQKMVEADPLVDELVEEIRSGDADWLLNP